MRARLWRRGAFVLAAFSVLAGCTNGDFGEVRPTLVNDKIHDWVGVTATDGQPGLPSSFELTDDERQLRDLAYPLIEPTYNRQQWYSAAREHGFLGGDRTGFDRAAYANHLLGSGYRSPSARYSQLIDDIRNDQTSLPQFFETAGRVLDIDQKRRKSMAYIGGLSASDRANALRRIKENASIISLVRVKLDQRVASYRFALERLVLMTPSQQAIEAERALNRLQAAVAHYRTHTAPTWSREQSLAFSR